MPIIQLIQHWPFLLREIRLQIHFQLLMTINIQECLKDSGKVEKLWAFLKDNSLKFNRNSEPVRVAWLRYLSVINNNTLITVIDETEDF